MKKSGNGHPLEAAVHAPIEELEVLQQAASDRGLSEDLALTLLRRRDMPVQVLEALGKNVAISRLRTVRWALITHPRSPRHTSLPLLRHLYPFELMKLAVVPHLAADLKRAAEDVLVMKVVSLSAGERLSLAKQGSSRIAAELLRDSEPRVMNAALDNPRLTEDGVVRSLLQVETTPHLAPAVCHHSKWRTRFEVQIAALRCEFTPLAFAIDFASRRSAPQLRDILAQSKLPENIKTYLLDIAKRRTSKS
jgi:hypothetical protein